MEVRLLGPIAIEGNGAKATLGGSQRRAVVALLALAEGRVVSVDALVEALWGERPPPTAVNTVQVHVSALRKALALVSDEGKEAIVREGSGYRLAVSPTSLDHVRFIRLTNEGQVLLSRGDAAHARAVFAQALALWRGPALADFEYEEWAQPEARRLDDLRLSCLEGRIEAELASGRHSQLVGELEALVAEHPERERFTAQLLLALYRSGRQTEALDVYQRARARLVNELGIDPSPELQALNRGILNQDETLISPVRTDAPLVKLPAAPTPIVGRHSEQAELIAILSEEGARLVTVTGPGGVGKTRLAVEAASGLAELFPGGVFFVALAPLQEATLVPRPSRTSWGLAKAAINRCSSCSNVTFRANALCSSLTTSSMSSTRRAWRQNSSRPRPASRSSRQVAFPYASTVSMSTPSSRSPSPTPTGCPRPTNSRTSTPWRFSMLAPAPRTGSSSSLRPMLLRSPRSVHGSTVCRSRSSSLLHA